MKRSLPIAVVCFTSLILLGACKQEFKYTNIWPSRDQVFPIQIFEDKKFSPDHFNVEGELYYLCKVWGVLSFYHIKDEPTLNQNLLTSLKKLLQEHESSPNNFNNLLSGLIDSTYTYRYIKGSSFEKDSLEKFKNKNFPWLLDSSYLSKETADKLAAIILKHNASINSTPVVSQNNIGVVQYSEYSPGNEDFPSVTSRLIGLYHYWNLINYHYVYKNLIDANWDEVLYQSIPKFRITNSFTSYQKYILELIANLDDNHSIVHPKILTKTFGTYVPNFRVLKIDGKFIIKNIRTRQLSGGGLRPGDIILAYNGIAMERLSDSLQKFVSGANSWSRQRELNKLLFCNRKENNVITIERDGKISNLKIKAYNFQKLYQLERGYHKKFKDQLAIKWIGKIAYVHINNLFEENFEENLSEIKKSSSLIIDMRGYPNSGVSSKLLNLVITKNDTFFISVYPDIDKPGIFRYSRNEVPIIIHSGYKYHNKIVLLVDETTQSQAEFIVMAMQLNKKVITIGNTSAGSNGNVAGFTFPGNIDVKYSGLGIYYSDFTQTQRSGVRIDYNVFNQLNDLQTHRDPWLELAKTILHQKFDEN
ncbi:MAG TPA: S41 family peptidase [Luteibaculaceae bacterium]|nr:S41 family peptidase [Luteibaculaceae bacterium]